MPTTALRVGSDRRYRWLPAQHGAWCLLGIAAALGFVSSGGLSVVGGAAATVIALGFVATHVLASGAGREVPALLRWGGAAGLVGGAAGVAIAAPSALVPLVLAAGAGWVSAGALLRGGPAAPQAVIAGGLAAGGAAAAVAAAGGAEAGVVVWVATLMGLFALGRLAAVLVIFTRWNETAPAILAAIVPLGIVALLAVVRGAGWWAPLAFLPAAGLGLWLATSECRPSSRRCGLTEFAGAVAFLLLAGIDVVP
ncbi:MAG: hypothetical protein ACYTGX_01170 [Planctomycetota bacterium]|jgi:hypothetical protein